MKKYLMHVLVVHVQEEYNNMFGVGAFIEISLHTHELLENWICFIGHVSPWIYMRKSSCMCCKAMKVRFWILVSLSSGFLEF
jgi:hypothetical protein